MRPSVRGSESQTKRPGLPRCFLLPAILLTLGASSYASSQEANRPQLPLPAQAQAEIPIQRMPINQQRRQPPIVADEDVADDEAVIWGLGVFGRMDGQTMRESMFVALGGSEAAFEKLKREGIQRELDRINVICSLTDQQLEKLNKAIELDIQHVHAKFETALSNFDSKMTVQQFQQIQQEIYAIAGTLNADSKQDKDVWRKVLRSQLTIEQTIKIAEDRQKVEANQSRTRQLEILLLLQRKLGLTAAQRKLMSEWIKEKNANRFDFATIWKMLASVDDNAIPFTPTQHKLLAQPLGPADLTEKQIGELPQLNAIPVLQIRQP